MDECIQNLVPSCLYSLLALAALQKAWILMIASTWEQNKKTFSQAMVAQPSLLCLTYLYV